MELLKIYYVFPVLSALLVSSVFTSPLNEGIEKNGKEENFEMKKVEVVNANPPPDRSVYARKASAVANVISDVYEVFVGPSNYFQHEKIGIAVFHRNENNSEIVGKLMFIQNRNDAAVKINGTIMGLKPGKHGFHIHEKGDLSNGCESTGKHFNPYLQPHGSPKDSNRHIGDLGNIEANEEGIARVEIEDPLISLSGAKSIIGRSIVIDDLEDNFEKERDSDAGKGQILACGIIGLFK